MPTDGLVALAAHPLVVLGVAQARRARPRRSSPPGSSACSGLPARVPTAGARESAAISAPVGRTAAARPRPRRAASRMATSSMVPAVAVGRAARRPSRWPRPSVGDWLPLVTTPIGSASPRRVAPGGRGGRCRGRAARGRRAAPRRAAPRPRRRSASAARRSRRAPVELDEAAEAGLERGRVAVELVAVERHAGLEAQRVAGAQAARAARPVAAPGRRGARPRAPGRPSQCDEQLEAVLAGVAGARDAAPSTPATRPAAQRVGAQRRRASTSVSGARISAARGPWTREQRGLERRVVELARRGRRAARASSAATIARVATRWARRGTLVGAVR